MNGRICANGLRVHREVVEDRLLAGFKNSLLTEESIDEFRTRFRQRLMQRSPTPVKKRRTTLAVEIARLVEAVGKGLLSPSLSTRLQEAETELANLPPDEINVVSIESLLKRLPEAAGRFRLMAERLGDAPIDVQRGRELLREILGEIRISPRDGYLVAKMGLAIQPLSGSSIRGSGGPIWQSVATLPRRPRRG